MSTKSAADPACYVKDSDEPVITRIHARKCGSGVLVGSTAEGGSISADSHAARSTPLQAYSKRKRRPPHQGTLVSEMSAERSTGE
jgi:hypothetical protein